jgi:hypothetical protein
MRNAPRKKVSASTGWSCGPAMKTSLITKRGLALVEQFRVGSVGSSQALRPHVLPILKDRRQARGESHQLLHLDAQMSPRAFRAEPR